MSYKLAALNYLLEIRKSGKWIDCTQVSTTIKASYPATDASLQMLRKAGCVERQRQFPATPGSRRRVWHYRLIPSLTRAEIMRLAGEAKDKPRSRPMVSISAALDALFGALNKTLQPTGEHHGISQ